jgi:hypothetical protein
VPFRAKRTICLFISFVKIEKKGEGLEHGLHAGPAHGGINSPRFWGVTTVGRMNGSISNRPALFAGPGTRVVQEIIIDVVDHAARTQVNEHQVGNLPDNQ